MEECLYTNKQTNKQTLLQSTKIRQDYTFGIRDEFSAIVSPFISILLFGQSNLKLNSKTIKIFIPTSSWSNKSFLNSNVHLQIESLCYLVRISTI